jgi:hypothetical protein
MDIVGQRNRRVARVGIAFSANLQLAAVQDPLGGKLDFLVIGKDERAVQVNTIQSWRTDIKDKI